MKIKLSSIELDTSIQCRATIDTTVVGEYADAMENGATFPPIEVFGTAEKSWIGDGWHRFMAAQQETFLDIEAHLNPGGRLEAFKHALGANDEHGLRRSNADKRHAVTGALREFPGLSSNAIAKMCGVANHMVDSVRGIQVGENPTSTRLGADGKQYPAHRAAPPPQPKTFVEDDEPETFEEPEPQTEKEEEQDEQTEGEAKSGPRPQARGSYEDWRKLRELCQSADGLANEIGLLRVDMPHLSNAADLCQLLANKFSKIAQNIWRQ